MDYGTNSVRDLKKIKFLRSDSDRRSTYPDAAKFDETVMPL